MTAADYQQLNGIALAYLGDAVYEVLIRQHLLALGMTKPNRLQHKATNYVSAKAQAALIARMAEVELLSDEEWAYYRRGRNAKSYTHAKNTAVLTYRQSTGFEALFGYLQLAGQTDRVQELGRWCIQQVERGGLQREQ